MKNVWMAIILIGIGGLLLLSNLNLISFDMDFSWAFIYPFLVLLLGAKIWLDALFKKGSSWIVGSFLFIVGSLLCLDRFGLIEFSLRDIIDLWPLLFIYIGVSLFVGKKRRFKTTIHSARRPKAKSSHLLIGDVSLKDDNWKLEPLDLFFGIGDAYVDFSKAFIPDQETPVYVKGWVGDVKMLIPKHIPIRVEAMVNTGDIKLLGHKADGLKRRLDYESEEYENATRRLTIFIELKVGSIRVEQV